MRKRYLYIALGSLLAAVISTSVYAQQITGKGAGAVLNISAFDLIVSKADGDLEHFLACSAQGLFLQTADGDNCILARSPDRLWLTNNSPDPAADTPAGGAPSDTFVYLRFENPTDAPSTEIPAPRPWGPSSASLYGDRGTDGSYLYFNSSGSTPVKTCPHGNPGC